MPRRSVLGPVHVHDSPEGRYVVLAFYRTGQAARGIAYREFEHDGDPIVGRLVLPHHVDKALGRPRVVSITVRRDGVSAHTRPLFGASGG